LAFAWRAPGETKSESFRVPGEEWREMASYIARRDPISPGEESSISPSETKLPPTTQAQIWGSASNLALVTPKTHSTSLIDT
ncbi:hypothetical protein A2U01_0074120, partial [Trifolium medium]|nr:hypothetical protein [Trifolium medium]